jgi:hypothetical protein
MRALCGATDAAIDEAAAAAAAAAAVAGGGPAAAGLRVRADGPCRAVNWPASNSFNLSVCVCLNGAGAVVRAVCCDDTAAAGAEVDAAPPPPLPLPLPLLLGGPPLEGRDRAAPTVATVAVRV